MTGNVAKINYHGHEYEMLSLTPNDSIHNHHKRTGSFYELSNLEVIKGLKLKGTCLDIGANIGNHTVFFGEECSFEKILAVEMVPEVYNVLIENAVWNIKKTSTDIWNLAILDKEAMVSHVPVLTHCVGGTTMVDEPGKIPGTTIDALMKDRKVPPVTFIKLDIEGSEYKALLGAKETLAKFKPVILCETWDDISPKYDQDIASVLEPLGYKRFHKVGFAPAVTFWRHGG